MSSRRHGTQTRAFGSGFRENHDSSAYYARELMPLDVESDIEHNPLPENPLPQYARNQIFSKGITDLKELPDRCVHLLLASPPLNMVSDQVVDISLGQHLDLFGKVVREAYRVLVDGGRACVMVSNAGQSPYIPLHTLLIEIASRAGFFMRGEIIWDEGEQRSMVFRDFQRPGAHHWPNETHGYILVFQKPPFGRKRPEGREATISRETFLENTKSFWRVPTSGFLEFEENSQLLGELARRLIHLYTYSGEIILDPYAGNNGIVDAVQGNGRVFVGFTLGNSFQERPHPHVRKLQLNLGSPSLGVRPRDRVDGGILLAYPDAAQVGLRPKRVNELPPDSRNRIHLASSEHMSQLPDRCIDLMFTSPPYNVGKEYDDELTMGEYLGLLRRVLSETYRVLVDGGQAGVNVANIGRKPYIPLHSYVVEIALEVGFSMTGEIIWEKGMSGASTAWGSWMSPANPTLRDTHEYVLLFQKLEGPTGANADGIRHDQIAKERGSVWRIAPASAKHSKHPAPFPVELPRRMIDLYSNVGDVILDPFMGTGATAVAADECERYFVGYEINPEYVATAHERIEEARISQRFVRIARDKYSLFGDNLSSSSLSRYFESCFDESIRQLGLVPVWICKLCTLNDKPEYGRGEKPLKCPSCDGDRVFYVGDFQSRASAVGSTFRAAVQVLFEKTFGTMLSASDAGVRTHNLEASPTIAVEAKGSPTQYGRPGMKRSDTRKKTHDNARRYKNEHPNNVFFVVSNSFPEHAQDIRSADVDGYFDVTDPDQIEALNSRIKNILDQFG